MLRSLRAAANMTCTWKALEDCRETMCFTTTDRTNYPCLTAHTQGTSKGKRVLTAFFTLAPGCSISLWLHSRCIGTWGNGLLFPLTIFIYSKYTSPFGQQLLNNHFQAIACGHMEGSERKTALNVNCDACLYEEVAFWVICMVERKKGLENL